VVDPDPSAYLFRDANHLTRFWSSELGAQYKKQAEEQVKIKTLGPTFFRNAPGRPEPKKKISTAVRPGRRQAAHAARRRLAAARPLARRNPTPMALRETYTGLQTGAIDGQDNPLPKRADMKFLRGDVADRAHLALSATTCFPSTSRPGTRWAPRAEISRRQPTRRSPGARPST